MIIFNMFLWFWEFIIGNFQLLTCIICMILSWFTFIESSLFARITGNAPKRISVSFGSGGIAQLERFDWLIGIFYRCRYRATIDLAAVIRIKKRIKRLFVECATFPTRRATSRSPLSCRAALSAGQLNTSLIYFNSLLAYSWWIPERFLQMGLQGSSGILRDSQVFLCFVSYIIQDSW